MLAQVGFHLEMRRFINTTQCIPLSGLLLLAEICERTLKEKKTRIFIKMSMCVSHFAWHNKTVFNYIDVWFKSCNLVTFPFQWPAQHRRPQQREFCLINMHTKPPTPYHKTPQTHVNGIIGVLETHPPPCQMTTQTSSTSTTPDLRNLYRSQQVICQTGLMFRKHLCYLNPWLCWMILVVR